MKSRKKPTRRFATLASRLTASAFMSLTSVQLASAADSDPLVPSRHMPRGADIGPTDCSIGDSATTLSSCQNDIRSARRQLAAWSTHHEEDAFRGVADEYLKVRMQLKKQIQNDSSVIRVLLARPGKAGSVPNGLEPQAGETHKANQVWSGVELSTQPYTAPSDYNGIYSVQGSFTVPAMRVPDTGNGLCDGKNNKSYSQSWWIGIGGDPNGSIYQAGVKGVLICSPGSTAPAAT